MSPSSFFAAVRRHPLSFAAYVCLTLLSLLPFPDVPQLGDIPLMDKWVHFVMYGGAALAAWTEWAWTAARCGRTSARRGEVSARRDGIAARREEGRAGRSLLPAALWLAVVCPVAFGALMEVAQACTPYRSGDFADFVADAVGVALAMPLGLWVVRPVVAHRVRRSRSKSAPHSR